MNAEFKNGSQQRRRDMIGNTIYETVEKIVGQERAPKITGMLIDLSELELSQAIMTYENLEQKIHIALKMLTDSEANGIIHKNDTQITPQKSTNTAIPH